jgi:hypothetical protein
MRRVRSEAFRASAAAAALLCACAVLAACGGGSSAQERRYVAAGDAICARELAELNRVPEPTTPTQAITYLPRAIAFIKRESAQLAALSLPPSRRAPLDAALSAGSQLASALARFLQQLRAGTVELATFAQVQTQSTDLRAQMNRHFRAAGLVRCVSGP